MHEIRLQCWIMRQGLKDARHEASISHVDEAFEAALAELVLISSENTGIQPNLFSKIAALPHPHARKPIMKPCSRSSQMCTGENWLPAKTNINIS